MTGGPDPIPYGSWPSPLSADVLVSHTVSLGELRSGLDDLWWSELRPAEQGRVVIVRHRPGGDTVDVLPEGYSARTRVHAYGGGAWWLHDDIVFFANWDDQRLYRLDPGDAAPHPLTAEPATPGGIRYADGAVTPDNRWTVCVRETHDAGGGEPVNELVAIATDATPQADPHVLVSGPDFVSSPRVSGDGRRLCWLQWDHPHMPWDGTELWVAELDEADGVPTLDNSRLLTGGAHEAICQPQWSADGRLFFLSDLDDWWNLYRVDPSGGDTEPVTRLDGEIGLPHWVFAQARYAELVDGRVLCAYAHGGVDHLAVVDLDGEVHPLPTGFTSIASVQRFGDGAALIAAEPTSEPSVLVADVGGGPQPTLEVAVARPARDLGVGREWFSAPEAISFPTTGDAVAHALFYRPTNPQARGPADQRPPLVVICHGGPTSAARPQLNLTTQYWTSRGLAVVDVNYRGSTGYGRAYRRALERQWGVVDVEDCIAAARFLAAEGEVDPDRLFIRGSSAGGFTTLCALTFHDDFRAGASLYGIADLEALARDTHKFEARYLDSLVGPYPDDLATYEARSPIHHIEGLHCPTIVFQGLEDEVVPPEQAEAIVAALRSKGVPVAYLTFEGEQHGFRRSENIRRVLEAELYFLARVFGFDLADEVEPVPIENL